MKPLAVAFLLTLFTSQGTAYLPAPKPDPRIAEHLPLARSIARKFLPNMGGMLDLDDLVSVALQAMWEATPSFDDKRGVKFGQFARSCMRLALRRQQRDVWNKQRRVWLEQTSIHPDGDDYRGIELVTGWPDPERAYSTYELATAVLNTTTGRDRQLIRQLFLGDTLADAGKDAGVSRERARCIQEQAFRIAKRRVGRSHKSTSTQQVVIDESMREVHLLESDFVVPMPTDRKGAQRDA